MKLEGQGVSPSMGLNMSRVRKVCCFCLGLVYIDLDPLGFDNAVCKKGYSFLFWFG